MGINKENIAKIRQHIWHLSFKYIFQELYEIQQQNGTQLFHNFLSLLYFLLSCNSKILF